MADQEKIEKLIYLIQVSALDQTIKDILIRDLRNDGLTDFLREQIKAYCLEGLKVIDARIAAAQQILEERESVNSSPVA